MHLMTCPDTGRSDRAAESSATSEISEILQQQLRRSPHADLRNVQVDIEDGIIRLHGRVHCFHAKQMAHIIVRDEFHVSRVENAIVVA